MERCRHGLADAASLQFVLSVRIRRCGAASLPPKVNPVYSLHFKQFSPVSRSLIIIFFDSNFFLLNLFYPCVGIVNKLTCFSSCLPLFDIYFAFNSKMPDILLSIVPVFFFYFIYFFLDGFESQGKKNKKKTN